MRGLGNEIFGKFASWELKFWPKQGWKWKNFLKFENGGHKSGTMMVNLEARERPLAWKKGVMTAAHPHTPFLGQCPPPGSQPPHSALCWILDHWLGNGHVTADHRKWRRGHSRCPYQGLDFDANQRIDSRRDSCHTIDARIKVDSRERYHD